MTQRLYNIYVQLQLRCRNTHNQTTKFFFLSSLTQAHSVGLVKDFYVNVDVFSRFYAGFDNRAVGYLVKTDLLTYKFVPCINDMSKTEILNVCIYSWMRQFDAMSSFAMLLLSYEFATWIAPAILILLILYTLLWTKKIPIQKYKWITWMIFPEGDHKKNYAYKAKPCCWDLWRELNQTEIISMIIYQILVCGSVDMWIYMQMYLW